MAKILTSPTWHRLEAPANWVDLAARTRAVGRVPARLKGMYAIAEVMFATAEGVPSADLLTWVVNRTDGFARDVGGKGALAFRAGVALTDWVSPLMIGRLPPMWKLDLDDRIRAMERYEASILGMSMFAVKIFLSLNYFEHPDVAEDVGFDGTCRDVELP